MILVTGATGTTGSEVVRQLTAAGIEVRALVRSPQKAKAIAGTGAEIVLGDLGKPATLDAALEGVERVFLVSSPDPNVGALHRNLYEAAKRAGVRHLVRMSAIGSRAGAPERLLRWHGESEEDLERSGLPWTHLKPHFFMQNTLMFAPTVAGDGAFYAPMKDGRIALVDIRDIAAVAVAVLTGSGHEGHSYDITGPESLSFADLGAALSEATGRPVKYVDVPPEAARAGMIQAGVPDWLADGLVELYARFSAGREAAVSPVVRQLTAKNGRTFAAFAREHRAAFGAR